jgi:alpha-glucosidase/alpha-D-xyloside xylohydrolase
MPIVRALWLHYPDDSTAVALGDQYLWGRDLLVAPVVEKGATSRQLYLPRGTWFDFWTEERLEGGREIERPVDLATMPLYARAGALIPTGPVKQYTSEVVAGPLTVTVYPGADGAFALFEDDGASFDYRRGVWMGISFNWTDRTRRLTMALTQGSRMRQPLVRDVEVRVAGQNATRSVKFSGRPVTVDV